MSATKQNEKQAPPDLTDAIIAEAKQAVRGAKHQPAKSGAYGRILSSDGKTLAYVFPSKHGTRVDVYAEASQLPAEAKKLFAPARGRARKDGLVATVASEGDAKTAGAAIKVAAEALKSAKAAPAKTAEPEGDEFSADLKEAAAEADRKAAAAAEKKAKKPTAKPDPKPTNRAKVIA